MREFRNQITYNQLITFKAIVEAGNISKASMQLGISSASVSYSLKSLEKAIGQPLFVRSTRVITPTEVGLQLYTRTRTAVDNLTGAVDYICDLNETPTGTIALNMARSIYQYMLKPLLADFQNAYPSIQLELTLSDTLDSRTEQAIDVGFRYGEQVEENLIAKPISHFFPPMKLIVYASKSYVDKHGAPQTLAELSSHAFIKFRFPTSRQVAPVRLHKTRDPNSEIVVIDTPTAMVVNDADMLIDMVKQGLGLGIMGDLSFQDEVARGELIHILPDHWCDLPNVYMYYARESKQALKVRTFLDFMNTHMGK